MARIRTVKPSFFSHYELYQLEIETKLPLRVAYSGLWTQCDREGRFKWSAPELKLGCLPYDEIDFSRVLDALWTRGFIEKYACSGREYGYVPSFLAHQVINNRESDSVLPEPNENNILTRDGRVIDACATSLFPAQVEGKGREGNRKGKEGKGREGAKHTANYSPEFELFWQAYPYKTGKDKALESWNKKKPDLQEVLNSLVWQVSSESWTKENGKYIPMPATYLNGGRWKDEPLKLFAQPQSSNDQAREDARQILFGKQEKEIESI